MKFWGPYFFPAFSPEGPGQGDSAFLEGWGSQQDRALSLEWPRTWLLHFILPRENWGCLCWREGAGDKMVCVCVCDKDTYCVRAMCGMEV